MTLSATPALDADHMVAFTQHAKVDGILDTPSKTSIYIFLPVGLIEVGLLFWEQEWIDTSIKMGILSKSVT